MTATMPDDTLTVVGVAEPQAEVAAPGDPKRAARGLVLIALGVVLVGVLSVEFVVGSVLQQRDQRAAAAELEENLAAATSTIGLPDLSPLPVIAPAVGQPVAAMAIPAISVEQVVLEGDTHGVLQSGPGHVSGTPWPGQPGNVGVIGRRTTYGAPFFSLDELQVGDAITTTTVQGTATYTVTSVGVTDARDPFARSAKNTLTLLTGNPPGVALDQLVVVAELEGKPFVPTPQNARTFANPLAPDLSNWSDIVVWGLLLGLVLVASVVAWQRAVPRVVIWVLAVPTVGACLLLFARSVDYLLPSVL